MGAPKIAHHVFLRVTTFLVSNNHAALPVEHGETTRHCSIVCKTPVAMQFAPVCKTSFNVIESKRPLRMPRDLYTLPGRQVAVNLAARVPQLPLNRRHRRIKLDTMLTRIRLHSLPPPFRLQYTL